MMRQGMMQRKGMVVLVLSLVITLASAVPAAAHTTYAMNEDSWADIGAVGYCGVTKGNYVRAIQTILNSALLLPKSGIDGVWGPQSTAALKKWQLRHGLNADGCAGWRTLNEMQYGTDRVCPPRLGCYTVRHFEQTVTDGDVWRWREPQSDPTHYAYFLWDVNNLCWKVKVGGKYIPIDSCVAS